jgi:hypothetical protein
MLVHMNSRVLEKEKGQTLTCLSIGPTRLGAANPKPKLFFAKAKVTGVTVLLTVYHSLISAADAPPFIYGRAERLCLLHALAAYRSLQLVTRKESFSALVASQAVHLTLWFPSKQSHIFQEFAFSSHFTLKNEQEQCYPTEARALGTFFHHNEPEAYLASC